MSASLTSRVAYNTAVQFIGKAATAAIAMVTLALLTRYLGVRGYGEYTTVFAFLGFFTVLADFGLFSIMVRDIAKSPLRQDEIFGNILTFRVVVAVIVLSLSAVIVHFIPKYSFNIKVGVAVAASACFFLLSSQTVAGVFQAHLQMHRFVAIETGGRALILLLVMFCIRRDLGFIPVLAANSLGNLAAFILSLALVRRFIRVQLRLDWEYWRWLLPEVLPMGVIVVLGVVYWKIDQIILSLVWGSREVGVYGVPYKILEILVALPAVFVSSVLPVISRYIADRDERLFGSLQRAFDFLVLLGVPTVLGVFLIAPAVIGLFAGPEFAASVPLLRILIVAVGLVFVGTLAGNLLIAANLQKRLVRVYVITAVGNIGLNLIFIPMYSYYAAAIITVITEIWACSAAYAIVNRHLAWKPRLDSLWKAIGAGAAMSAVVLVAQGMSLAVQIGLGALSYFLILFLVGGIDAGMIRAVFGRTP